MSDDPTPDDEIISAYLDGEATPAEVARVRADPSLLSAVAELETLREQLSVDGPPAGLVDDHVERALAAFDPAGVDGVAPTAVTDLSTRRRPLLQRLPLGAIAAAVVLLALFGALTQIDTGDDDSAADETAAVAEDSGDDAAGSDGDLEDLFSDDAAESDVPDGEADAGARAPFALAFTDTDELARHLSAVYAERDSTDRSDDPEVSTTSAAASEERAVDPCNAVAVADVDPSDVALVFPTVVAGSPVTAVVAEPAGDGERRLVVVDDGSCTVVDDRPL